MAQWVKISAILLTTISVVVLVALYALFGGGVPYPDLSGDPLLPQGTIEAAVVSDRPIGNAAVSATGRIFYTIHPESQPTGTKLYEWSDGKALPYPNEAEQAALFDTPLGLAIDANNLLWVIDPANHGSGTARLSAFDLATNKLVHSHDFASDIAPLGSFLQDLQVSSDGRWIYYGAMNHDTLYRVPTQALQDPASSDETVAAAIEIVGKKPLNDGFSIDEDNNIFITDVEHQAVVRMAPDGTLQTIVKDSRIRWADGLSFGPDGMLYLADSAIPHLALQPQDHITAQAPFYIWRFKPGTKGRAGQ